MVFMWIRFVLVIVASMTMTHGVWAKPKPKARQAALKLGGEALDLYAAADYQAALKKFVEADSDCGCSDAEAPHRTLPGQAR